MSKVARFKGIKFKRGFFRIESSKLLGFFYKTKQTLKIISKNGAIFIIDSQIQMLVKMSSHAVQACVFVMSTL